MLWDQGKDAEAEPLLRQYDIEVGGTVEESAKSQASVFAVVPAMLFITVTLLIIQLQSFSRMFLVLSVVPIGPDWRRRRVAHFADGASLSGFRNTTASGGTVSRIECCWPCQGNGSEGTPPVFPILLPP